MQKSLLIADVSRAFFEAFARRDLCVELPEEALSVGESPQEVVGKHKAPAGASLSSDSKIRSTHRPNRRKGIVFRGGVS